MNKVNTKTLKGFRELLPAEQMAFNKMLGIIRDTYELYGFIPLDTPVLERAEALLAKAGGETEKQIYQFTKGKTDYAMRFDLTVPLARYVAEHARELSFPFRRYAIGKVYRGERPQAGRLREFYQCDIDIIDKGELSLTADIEIPQIINRIFDDILPNLKFTIKVNNRKILNGFYEELGVDQESTLRIVDKLDKIGVEGISKELSNSGVEDTTINKILDFVNIKGANECVIQQLEQMDIKNEQFVTGIKELAQIANSLSILQIDLSVARGLDYYTGTVYETTLNDYPQIGSICSGGRYDNLIGTYSNTKLPGVGISIGLSRLFDQLKTYDLLKTNSSTPTKVFIIPISSSVECVYEAYRIADTLRDVKIPTEVSTIFKLDKAIKYADKLNINKVIIIGEDELAKSYYTLKNMTTGTQTQIDKENILTEIVNILQLSDK